MNFLPVSKCEFGKKNASRGEQASITEWLIRRKELTQERKKLVQNKNGIELKLLDIRNQTRQLSGLNKSVDLASGKFLDKRQMEQYTEGLRAVIHSELSSLLGIRPLLESFIRFKRKYGKARQKLALLKKEYDGATDNPLELLSASLNILKAFEDRFGSENLTDEEKKIISFIENYLLIFEQLDTIGEEKNPLEETAE